MLAASQDEVPLQAIQIVKGYLDGGEYKLEVLHVGGDETTTATVISTHVIYKANGMGSTELCEVWTDDFVRSWHNGPSTTHESSRTQPADGQRLNATPVNTIARIQTVPFDERCCDPRLGLNRDACAAVDCSAPGSVTDSSKPCCNFPWRPSLQERAWSSPIWFTPES